MAEIDKSLPNVKQKIEIAGPEESQVDIQETAEQAPEGVEVTPTEDGGAEINFDPRSVNQEQTENHFDNLAELLPDDVLDPLGNLLYTNYQDYKTSRRDWEQSYTSGLDLLGFKYETRTEPFRGASGTTHPVMAEAVTQFQAQAYKELLPSEGPVRTQILGMPDRNKRLSGSVLRYLIRGYGSHYAYRKNV